MIIDKFENLPLYFSCLPGLDKAAEFLAGENIADGHYEIDGEKIFANVSSYEPKEFNSDMRFEAHRKYADLQAVLEGEERIDWAPLGSLREESEEYSKGGDIAFYSGDEHMRVTLGGRISYSVPRRRAQALHPQRRKSEESGSKARAVKRAFG